MITTMALSPAVDKIYFLDHFEAGRLYRASRTIVSPGGKGINVARVASILGQKVGTAGFKAGNAGEWLESKLRELGVQTNFIRVPGESRTNNNIIDPTSGTETEILEIGPQISSDDRKSFLEVFRSILPGTEVLVCSGGLPEGIPADFYRTLISLTQPLGVKCILDSNGVMLEEGIKAKPWLVKPNLRELSKYAGKELSGMDDILDACRRMLAEGVKMVAASLGKDGAILVWDKGAIHGFIHPVPIVNTIGSGDSMVAGLAAGLLRGSLPEELLRFGMACALANTQFQEIGMVSMELIEKFYNEIQVQSLI